MHVVHGEVAVVLFHQTVGALLERLGVCFGPPVAKISFGVELAALIVEAMGQLMADDRANCAVIYGVVHFVVIKRRLKNSGGEIHVVFLSVVIGVDGGLGHLPIGLVHRFADFSKLPRQFEGAGAGGVSIKVVAGNLDAGVVEPMSFVSDLVRDGAELHQRLALG